MTNYLKVDRANRQLVMDRTFAKNSAIVGSREYAMLQMAKADYPDFTERVRTIKRNPNKKTYAGLTYEYMEDYICTHEPEDNIPIVLDEFYEMRLISECHSKAFQYPVIKRWFLNKYPEIANYATLKPTMYVEPGNVTQFKPTTDDTKEAS